MPAKIRSNYRRRLLTHLSVGACKVSEAALATGLRLPHASAELKKLRDEGHVAADRDDASRGAVQRLTSTGYALLESDELARLRALLRSGIPPGGEGCIVARDGDSLLLAYAKNPSRGLLLIPERGISDESTSTGNVGVGAHPFWAWPTEKGLRWYDANTLERIGMPEQTSIETIEGWSQRPMTVGLVRARSLSPNSTDSLAAGSWFSEEEWHVTPELPYSIRTGGWVLGEVHTKAPLVKPDAPVLAVVRERYVATMLCNAARDGAIVLSDRTSSSPLPVDILERWIHEAHPRLPPAELRDRLTQVQKAALTGWRARRRRSRVSTTWQRFRDSWQDVEWQENRFMDTNVEWDVSQLDDNALKAVMQWVVMESGQQLVVNWPAHRPFNSQLFEDLLCDNSVRLVVLPEELSTSALVVKEDTEGWPMARLVLNNKSEIPFVLSQHVEEKIRPPEGWFIPKCPDDLDSLPEMQASDGEPEDLEEAMLLSTSLYPEGDENWANRVETRYPEAAWIATPNQNRWARWQRVGLSIDSVWFDLLRPELVPLSELVDVSISAPVEWKKQASELLRAAIIKDPDILIDMRRRSKDSQSAAICSEHVLATAPWVIPHLGKGMANWAWNSWLESPTSDVIAALCGLDWCSKNGFIKKSWNKEVLQVSQNLEEQHPLRAWGNLVEWSAQIRTPSLFEMQAIADNLDGEWWAHLSPSILAAQLESEEGREWLLQSHRSWVAFCLRPKGERVNCPGIDAEHLGMTPGLHLLMRHYLVNMENSKAEGSAGLLDLLESIEDLISEEPPRSGRTHPCAGWLVRPVEQWSSISMLPTSIARDELIESRLRLGLSGFHEDLLSPSQVQLPSKD